MKEFDFSLEVLRGYKPKKTKKDDFDEFWERTISKAKEQPLNPVVKTIDEPHVGMDVEEIYIDGFEDSRIRLRYIRPTNIEKTKPLPTLIQFHGYNWDTQQPLSVAHWILAGYCVVLVDTRGQGLYSPDNNKYSNGAYTGFLTKGILNKDEYYYRYAYMDCYRAVEWAKIQVGVDKEKIIAIGGSQGGGLALATASLHEDIFAVVADVPFLSHFERAVLLSVGPYKEIDHFFRVHDPNHELHRNVYDTLSYFDCMNLVDRIKCRALLSVGLEDDICPPSTVFAVYNNIESQKDICVYYDFGHNVYEPHEQVKVKFMNEILN